jgi:hypothetical protein
VSKKQRAIMYLARIFVNSSKLKRQYPKLWRNYKMNLKPIASNMTELSLADGTQILFSYQTPVACWVNGQFYKTAKKWSNTTTRHVNKWAHCAINQPQEYFDNLVKGV